MALPQCFSPIHVNVLNVSNGTGLLCWFHQLASKFFGHHRELLRLYFADYFTAQLTTTQHWPASAAAADTNNSARAHWTFCCACASAANCLNNPRNTARGTRVSSSTSNNSQCHRRHLTASAPWRHIIIITLRRHQHQHWRPVTSWRDATYDGCCCSVNRRAASYDVKSAGHTSTRCACASRRSAKDSQRSSTTSVSIRNAYPSDVIICAQCNSRYGPLFWLR